MRGTDEGGARARGGRDCATALEVPYTNTCARRTFEGDGDGDDEDMAASASDAVRATARRRDRAAWDVGRRRLCVYFFFKSSMAVLYAGVVGGCTGSRRALVSSRA